MSAGRWAPERRTLVILPGGEEVRGWQDAADALRISINAAMNRASYDPERKAYRIAPPKPNGGRRVAGENSPEITERQLAILTLIARGATNTEIANTLSLSPRTVANSMPAIFEKLGATNRAAAAVIALQRGLITLEVDCEA